MDQLMWVQQYKFQDSQDYPIYCIIVDDTRNEYNNKEGKVPMMLKCSLTSSLSDTQSQSMSDVVSELLSEIGTKTL